MKQKYQITRNDENQTLTIREYAELDKDVLSPLCEEVYPMEAIQKAAEDEKAVLIAAIRTKNMYPPSAYAERIAAGVSALMQSGDQSLELFFDDIELLAADEQEPEKPVKKEVESDLEDLLEEDHEPDDLEDKEGLKKMNSSLKVAGDEYGDTDGDS